MPKSKWPQVRDNPVMTVATTYSSAELGIDAPLVIVEADVSSGLPQTLIVGLPETAVRESKDRVKAAIVSSGFEFPLQRITVNLAPADLPKSSGRYDLAIALSILAASGQIPGGKIEMFELLGELSLTGSLRAVRGVLPAALRSKGGRRRLIVPFANSDEAALAQSNHVLVANTLGSVVAHLIADEPLVSPIPGKRTTRSFPPLTDVIGQAAAKRALCIAAAGGHNMLMIGPPGTGKTMLASRLPGLVPDMDLEESLEVASVASVSRHSFDYRQWGQRPFRSPHHTASAIAMVGGSSPPKPGEISLAHHGVLFLDEVPEYSRQVLEVLRQPLESGEIWISRAAVQVRYPASFQLIAAMNPCPCGYYGDERHRCECTAERIHRYRSRLSGPLLDRIDLHVEVPPLPPGTLLQSTKKSGVSDKQIRQHIRLTRDRMINRQGILNSKLQSPGVDKFCRLSNKDQQFLDQSVTRLGISTRGYFKILKVARTIADLADVKSIDTPHLLEAIGYRRMDRLSP